MLEILILGFFLGMSHALEPDHIAAVGAMVLRKGASWKSLFHSGVFWGSGHSLMLLFVCGSVIVLDLALTDTTAAWLEMAVGGMLIGLGLNVFYRMRRQSLHVHAHEPQRQSPNAHDHRSHDHGHPSLRMMAIGLMHGAAGSAALLALAVAMTHSAVEALFYVAVFGVGSILGMGLLSMAAAWPIAIAENRWVGAIKLIGFGSGLLAISLGIHLVYEVSEILST